MKNGWKWSQKYIDNKSCWCDLDTDVDNFLIEDVPQVLKTYIQIEWEKILIPEYIKQKLWNKYNISFNILDVSDYWTPQTRKRAIILWSKYWEWGIPTPENKITVKEAIWHLPPLESWENSNIKYHYWSKHSANHILWMKHTPTWKTALNNDVYYPNKDWRKIRWFNTTYKRIDWDRLAPTITMCN